MRDGMLTEKKTLLDGLLRSAKQNENSFEKVLMILWALACISKQSLIKSAVLASMFSTFV